MRHERDTSETISIFAGAAVLALVAGCSVPKASFAPLDDAGPADADGAQALEASSATYDFGTIVAGHAGLPASITFANGGTIDTGELTAATLGGAAASQFSIAQDSCAGHVLRPGEQCAVAIALVAASSGSLAASVTVSAMPGGTTTVALTANVVEAGALAFSPATHDFGALPPGSTSADATFVATNTGGASTGTIAVALSGSDAGQFAIAADSCNNIILPAGGLCSIRVRFSPTVAGQKAATLTATTAAAGTAVATVGGKALAAAQLTASASADDFGDVVVGGSSASFGITYTNAGELPSGALAMEITGTDAAAFQLASDGCSGTTLAPAASCAVQLTFTPRGAGLASAVIGAQASPGGAIAIGITGTGLPPAALSFTPSSDDFGNQDVATTSAPAMFVLTNTGGEPTAAISASLAGSNAGDFAIAADGCSGMTLAASASCAVAVNFAPATFGARSATLRATAAVGGTTTASLAGTGRDKLMLTVGTGGGDGTGTVTAMPGTLACSGTTCTNLYYRGTVVTLTAVPDPMMLFGGWSGACSGTGTCTVTMSANTTVAAKFQQATEKLTLSTSSIAGATGSIKASPQGTSCGVGCLSFPTNSSVTLTAVPDAGFYLASWSGDCVGNGLTCTLAMTAPHTAAATFSPANKVFVTSGTFVPSPTNTVAWADATCQSAAAAANLPGTYVGWIGLGAATWSTHLGNASGWVRPDGVPFATSKAALLAGHNLYGNTITENGTAVPADTFVNSGTPGFDCMGWTQTSGGNALPGLAGGGWLEAATYDFADYPACGTPLALHCFETDYNVNVTYNRVAGRVAFVASSTQSGGGIAAFDAVCATQAANAGLPGSYLAFVGTSIASAASRFSSASTFVRTDGIPIAQATDLFAQDLSEPILLDQNQNPATSIIMAGARSPTEVADNNNCNDFTSTSGAQNFATGYTSFLNYVFFGLGIDRCDQGFGVYCLQQ